MVSLLNISLTLPIHALDEIGISSPTGMIKKALPVLSYAEGKAAVLLVASHRARQLWQSGAYSQYVSTATWRHACAFPR
jgi:hypothetical protein